MATEKTYTIIKTRGRTGVKTEYTDTLEGLIGTFRYTLESGHSYNSKINTSPRTASSLVNNLNKAISETQRGSFSPDDYELKA